LIEDKRVHIVQTKQDESVLEKLREKEWSRFEEKVIRQEKILQDDIYTAKAHAQASSVGTKEGIRI